MALLNDRALIAMLHLCSRLNHTRVISKSECASLINIITLSRHKINNLVPALLIKFPGMCFRKSSLIPGIFNDGNLHAKTDPEIRNPILSGIFSCSDHSFNSSVSKTAGNDDPVYSPENLSYVFFRNIL